MEAQAPNDHHGISQATSPVALVLVGGDRADGRLRARLPELAAVIAADSGLAQARVLGVAPTVVIGDMDSVDPTMLEEAASAGAEIERHPADKDATDIELALDRALQMECRSVIVVGGYGGRVDHLLGNALVLTAERFSTIDVEWWVAGTRIRVARQEVPVHIEGTAGDTVSLLAAAGDAHGVTTTGLRWSLENETLEAGSTRGISNELMGTAASVRVRRGVLLVVHGGRE
ncbi:MAG TPA: thiamine diphosphokinase [Acidimicrobiia bacterium]